MRRIETPEPGSVPTSRTTLDAPDELVDLVPYGGIVTPVRLPEGLTDERELLLAWLGFLRGAVVRNVEGVTERGAHWRPEGRLLSLLGIVNHLTNVEWRWIDGGFLGEPTERREEEFTPSDELTVPDALARYRARAASTDRTVRSLASLDVPCRTEEGTNLRWVLLHMLNETARHAGHADAVRELLDGTKGE
jgi:hypothetical protein